MYVANREFFLARNKAWRESASEEQRDRTRERARKSSERRKESIRRKHAAYRMENPARVKETARRWREKNRMVARARSKASREKKIDQYRQRIAEWAKRNRSKVAAKMAKYRALKHSATPLWADHEMIEEAYHLAQLRTKATGIQWHVDHIVPLQSPLVCGLHVEHNLQVIPAVMNLSKSNRFWPDMPA